MEDLSDGRWEGPGLAHDRLDGRSCDLKKGDLATFFPIAKTFMGVKNG